MTGKKSLNKVHSILASWLSSKQVRIYEAGGGSAPSIPGDVLTNAQVTVVDIDQSQLNKNHYASTKILGDIQTHAFPRGSFDLVVCHNVIEHLTAPDLAIEQFYRALTPGGLLFIAAPNPLSFSGWVTKLTPHWFHVWYYRHVLGYKAAGQPGTVPFPTIFHRIVRPQELLDFCRRLGFEVLYFCEYRGMVYEYLDHKRPLLGKLLNLTVQALNTLTLWRKDLRNGDYHVVLEKPLAIEATQPEQAPALASAGTGLGGMLG